MGLVMISKRNEQLTMSFNNLSNLNAFEIGFYYTIQKKHDKARWVSDKKTITYCGCKCSEITTNGHDLTINFDMIEAYAYE